MLTAIVRTYWRWLWRRSSKSTHRGVRIGVLWPGPTERAAVERVNDALNLLALHAPTQLKRLATLVDGVVLLDGGSGGLYMGWARLIVLRYDEAAPSSTRIACTLAHEATHAYLASRGIQSADSNRHRVEYICYRAEIVLARRLPNTESIIENAECALAQPPAFWSPEVRRHIDADELRELGVPELLVSAFIRLSRFVSRRRAAELAIAPDEREI